MRETPLQRNRRIFFDAMDRGEPVFVIRAKDRFAVVAIETYGALVAGDPQHEFDDNFGKALDDVLDEVKAWRRTHPDDVKYPDVRT